MSPLLSPAEPWHPQHPQALQVERDPPDERGFICSVTMSHCEGCAHRGETMPVWENKPCFASDFFSCLLPPPPPASCFARKHQQTKGLGKLLRAKSCTGQVRGNKCSLDQILFKRPEESSGLIELFLGHRAVNFYLKKCLPCFWKQNSIIKAAFKMGSSCSVETPQEGTTKP